MLSKLKARISTVLGKRRHRNNRVGHLGTDFDSVFSYKNSVHIQ